MTKISYDAQGREIQAPVRVEKVIYTPNYFGKEKGREKETFPPAPPIEKKGSQKKQSPVFLNLDILSPRVRARKTRRVAQEKLSTPRVRAWTVYIVVSQDILISLVARPRARAYARETAASRSSGWARYGRQNSLPRGEGTTEAPKCS
jgi:hypothetical protein